MIDRARNVKIGVFVLAGVTLFALALLILTGTRWRAETIPAFTRFNESVQGLEVGSEVKYRGVTVGRVTRIRVPGDDTNVRVDLEFHGDAFNLGSRSEVLDFLQAAVDRGARTRLVLAGITGFKYVDIDFYEPDVVSRTLDPGESPGEFGIPSVPSLLEGLSTNISFAVMKLAQVDIDTIGRDVSRLVVLLNRYLEEERMTRMINDLAATSANMKEISDKLARQFDEENVAQSIANLNKALVSIRNLAETVSRQLEDAKPAEVSTELRKTLGDFSRLAGRMETSLTTAEEALAELKTAAEASRKALEELKPAETGKQVRDTLTHADAAVLRFSTLRKDTEIALDRFTRAMDSLNALLLVLEEDPSAAIRGRRPRDAEAETP